MFLIVVPRIATNLEFYLLDLNPNFKVRNLINAMLKNIFADHVFVADFWNSDLDAFKRLSYNQGTAFKKIFYASTKDNFDGEELDQVFITILKESIELLYKIDPNSQGIENSLGQARREFRGNTWLEGYDTFRHISETVLLNFEKMSNSQIPALIFYYAKALEQLVNEIEEIRSRGIINLVYIDSQFIEMKRGVEYPNQVATLKLDQTSRTAFLRFHKQSNLLDRRSAQRLAHSVVKFGFELPDSTRIGLNYSLEVEDAEFT